MTQLDIQPDWLVVDHYGIDRKWELVVQPLVRRILVIDDLANREHAADLLLDQNELTDTTTRYCGLVPEHCRVLLGPRFLLLRPGFYKARQSYRPRDGKVRRLLVFFGGSDPTCETEKALKALADMERDDIEFHVVIGDANPRREQVMHICAQLRRATLHVQAENMAELMALADFSLGAGGGAMWERCYLGLPTAVTIVADNQRDSVNDAARLGAIWNLGWHDQVTSETYTAALQRALRSSGELKVMSSRGLEITGSRPSRQASPIIEFMLD